MGTRVSLPSQYDDFLYAVLEPPAHGPSITVLTLFARLDLDPWEEAARLAALSTQDAEVALAATLCRVAGEMRDPYEAKATACQLVARLPRISPSTRGASEPATVTSQRGSNFWLIWLCVQIFLLMLVSAQGRGKVENASGTDNGKPELTTKTAPPATSASHGLQPVTQAEPGVPAAAADSSADEMK